MKRISHSLLLAAACLAAPAAATAAPAGYPAQAVTMLVSFPPGGATDLVARAMAHEMSQDLGQSVVVVNRAGAGGALGTAAIANAAPDGHTIGLISVAALTIVPHLQKVAYGFDDFDFVCRAYDMPVFLMVAPGSRFQTLDEVLAEARANPGRLNYATVGPGSLPNMAALDLARAAGVEMNHVPYKGEAPAITDLLGGHVDLYFGTNAAATRYNLRRLAAAADGRVAEAADVPTLAEAGFPVVWSVVGGVLAPRGIAAEQRARLQASCARAAESPAYQAALANLNVRALYADGAAFREQLTRESELNRGLLASARLLPEDAAPASSR